MNNRCGGEKKDETHSPSLCFLALCKLGVSHVHQMKEMMDSCATMTNLSDLVKLCGITSVKALM